MTCLSPRKLSQLLIFRGFYMHVTCVRQFKMILCITLNSTIIITYLLLLLIVILCDALMRDRRFSAALHGEY